MAPRDGGGVTVECGGAIGVFGVGGQTGEVDVLGFAQGAGRHRLRGIHDEREGEQRRTRVSKGSRYVALAAKSDPNGPHVVPLPTIQCGWIAQIGVAPILRLGNGSDAE